MNTIFWKGHFNYRSSTRIRRYLLAIWWMDWLSSWKMFYAM